MEQSVKDFVLYIVALAPSIVSLCSCLAAVIMGFNKLKKACHDDATDMKELKKEYKDLNKTTKMVLEENMKLKEIIIDNQKNIELLTMEMNHQNGKEE